MRYYLIAGETSGDLHGASLIESLKKEDSQAEFRIVGGNQMQTATGQSALIHTSEMAFMGFVEVIKNLSTISRNLKAVKKDLLAYRPDTVILIDFPGFNLKIAEFAKNMASKYAITFHPRYGPGIRKECIRFVV